MTWSKFGDDFTDDPRYALCPRGVRYLRVEMTIWSNRHATDGRVPAALLHRVTDEPDPTAAADQLVDAGFLGLEGAEYVILDFLADQPSAADSERIRELNNARQRKQRQHRNGDHSLCDERYCRAAGSRVTERVTEEARVKQRDSHDSPTRPARPGTEYQGKGGGRGKLAHAPAASGLGVAQLAHEGEPSGGITIITPAGW